MNDNESDLTLERAAEILSYIDCHDRDKWLKACFALKSHFGDAAFDTWHGWSQGYPKWNHNELVRTWQGASPVGGVGIGTLFSLGREGGWTGRQPGVPARAPKTSAEMKRKEAAERKRKAERQRAAAAMAEAIIGMCRQETHPYLESKGLPEVAGLVADRANPAVAEICRVHGMPDGDPLVVPMREIRKWQVAGLQMIAPDGTKKYLSGSRYSGSALALNGAYGTRTFLCEGYATGHAILQAVKELNLRSFNVLVCFGDSNLVKVAAAYWRGLVIADNDRPAENGRRAGREAAKKSGLPWWEPPDEGTDANDFMVAHGRTALATEIRKFLNEVEKGK